MTKQLFQLYAGLQLLLLLSPQLHSEELPMHIRVVDAATQISLLAGDQLLLAYHKLPPPLPDGIDAVYARSGFIHPIKSPSGQTLTAVYPADHAHQDGLFSAWVNTTYDGHLVDFWNIARGTGRVSHHRVLRTFADESKAGFEVELVHHTAGDTAENILTERWLVSVASVEKDSYCIDVTSTQTCVAPKPLVVNKYHYGGFALRGRSDWLTDAKNLQKERTTAPELLNSLGSDRIKGNHEKPKWVSLYGPTAEGTASMTILSHPTNFRAQQATRLHPTKPYFCFAPCVDGEFTFKPGKSLENRYRIVVSDAEPDADRLNANWEHWAGQAAVD